MKSWYEEEYSFKITVVSVGNDGNARHCRNGHEPGDTYSCEYGCPMPMNGERGFCSKSMSKLFPLLEAVRAGGNLVSWTDQSEYDYSEFSQYYSRHAVYDSEEEEPAYHKRVLDIVKENSHK